MRRNRIAEGIASASVPGMDRAVQIAEARDKVRVAAVDAGMDPDETLAMADHRVVASPLPIIEAYDEFYHQIASRRVPESEESDDR